MAPDTRAQVRSLVEGADGSALGLIAIAAGLAAGILHLIVAPMHFAEHVGQGIFMVVAGSLQILWAVWFLRRATFGAYVAGLVLAVACIAVWLVATFVRPPFQSVPEDPSAMAWSTEAVQAITVLGLILLPFVGRRASAGSGIGVGRALPLVVLLLVLGLAAGGAAYGAGLVGESVGPAFLKTGSGDSMSPASTDAGTAGGSTSMAGMNTTSAANKTSPPAKDANMPSDPSACMSGMDMPGCSAAQADAYFAKMSANAPPPDKPLAPVKIALSQDGSGESGKFSLENGTMHLLAKVHLKDSGAGAWLVQGPGAAPSSGDLVITFTAPGAKAPAFSIPIKGSSGAGVDPGAALDLSATGENAMPPMGDWTIGVGGSGINADVTISLTERFVM